jgi:hypothetical protein
LSEEWAAFIYKEFLKTDLNVEKRTGLIKDFVTFGNKQMRGTPPLKQIL